MIESSLTDNVIATCSYAFLLGAIACSLIHKRAWIASLPDCRSPNCLPTWLLVIADGIGALLGPMMFMFLMTEQGGGDGSTQLSLSFILQGAAFCGVFLCIASACFGA